MQREIIDKFDVLFEIYNPTIIEKTCNRSPKEKTCKRIQKDEFITLLPEYLKDTTARKEYLTKLADMVTERHLIELLVKWLIDGSDCYSFYYLIRKFNNAGPNLKDQRDLTDIFSDAISPQRLQKFIVEKKNGKPYETEGLNYRDILQEAFYCFLALMELTRDEFIGKYMNDEHLAFSFQAKLEAGSLPSNEQFKMDIAFTVLHLVLEIDEHSHDENTSTVENDKDKDASFVVIGYSASRLKISKVFGMGAASFKGLPNAEVHKKLRESSYLKNFLKGFKTRVLSAMVKVEYIRNDYITYAFIIIIKEKIVSLIQRRDKEMDLLASGLSEDEAQSKIFINDDTILINKNEVLLKTITKNTTHRDIFALKEQCVKSVNKKAITFKQVAELLQLKNQSRINEFKLYLRQETDMISEVDFDEDSELFSWEDLLSIVMAYNIQPKVKETLKTYLLYVGKIYENIITMINSHDDSLVSNKEKFDRVMNRRDEKMHKSNKELKEKNTMLNAKLEHTNSLLGEYRTLFSNHKDDSGTVKFITPDYMTHEHSDTSKEHIAIMKSRFEQFTIAEATKKAAEKAAEEAIIKKSAKGIKKIKKMDIKKVKKEIVYASESDSD